MKKSLSFLCFVLFLATAFAQDALVKGRITIDAGGRPLAGALVRVKGTSDEGISDSSGVFGIRTTPGTIQIEVFSSSFPSPAIPPITLNAGEEKQLDIVMKQAEVASPLPVPVETPKAEMPDEVQAVSAKADSPVAEKTVIELPHETTKAHSVLISANKGNVVIKGKVTDEKDGSPMLGVNVKVKGTTNGMSSDLDGNYHISANAGLVQIEASYLGYQTRTLDVITLREGEEKTVNIIMTDAAKQLDIVVVTGSKYEKKLGEEVTSLDVLKGQNLTQSSQTVNEAMNKVPGVTMMGKTISIRGGSGFADATSNRVMALLDEIPLISPENGGIRWSTLPIEAIEQIEVVKGASSVAYGSSALNGSMNIRTINPKKDEPYNKILFNGGVYGLFQNSDWTWFYARNKSGAKIPPMFGGVAFVHARKYGDVDIVFNGARQVNQGYAYHLRSELYRAFLKVKYVPHKFDRLTVGVNFNFANEKYDDFFLYSGYHNQVIPNVIPGYRSGDSLVLFAAHTKPETDLVKTYAINVDPYVNFYDKHDGRHSLKVRYYHITSNSTSGDSSFSNQIYGEYSYNKKFRKLDMNVGAGISGYYTKVVSQTFGNRFAANAGAYLQVEKRFFKRLTIVAGVRLEYFKLDTTRSRNELDFINWASRRDSAHLLYSPVKPLFRIGLNYQPLEGTYIRASFGQGYRYPAIAEKFVQTPRSGAYAVPNFGLKPESGWSAEIGIKQGVKVSKWVFYADVAGFINHYRNMIEFLSVAGSESPVPIPPQYQFGIKAQAKNYTKAQILGMEVSAIGTGAIFGVPLNFLIGYTYLNPRNLHPDTADPTSKYLYFRVAHIAKADIQTVFKGVIIGFTSTITGPMLSIDPNYLTTGGNYRWRQEHLKTIDVVLDARLGYNFKDIFTGTLIVKNFTNHAYELRPGYIEPPVNFTLQLTYHWGQIFSKKKKDA